MKNYLEFTLWDMYNSCSFTHGNTRILTPSQKEKLCEECDFNKFCCNFPENWPTRLVILSDGVPAELAEEPKAPELATELVTKLKTELETRFTEDCAVINNYYGPVFFQGGKCEYIYGGENGKN